MSGSKDSQRHKKRPSPSGKSPHATRVVESGGSSRSPVYLDDDTLQRMIETFGPLEYSHESTPKSADPRYLLQSETPDQSASSGGSARKESILEWFDRSVEGELKKLREPNSPPAVVDPALAPLKAKHALNLTKGTAERVAESGASSVSIHADLERDFTTELTEAVEKLAKAENMSTYVEAVQAAEEAALNAPPELVEKAAAAEARRIQADVQQVKSTVPGVRPIEVVGYVGVTKPTHPIRSK